MKIFKYISISVLLICTVALASCGEKTVVPDNIIQPDQMTEILAEAYLIEGYFSQITHFRYDTLHENMAACYDSLFSKYGISSDDFDSSIAWYSQHPDIFSPIQDSVMNYVYVQE